MTAGLTIGLLGTAAVLCVNGVAATGGLTLRNEPRRSALFEAHPIAPTAPSSLRPTWLRRRTRDTRPAERPTDAHRVGPPPASAPTTSVAERPEVPTAQVELWPPDAGGPADRPTRRGAGHGSAAARGASAWPTGCRREAVGLADRRPPAAPDARPAGTRGIRRGAVTSPDAAACRRRADAGRPAPVTLIPFLAIAFGAAAAALIVRRYRRLSLAIGLLGLFAATIAALAIVPGDRLAVGPGPPRDDRVRAPVPRPRLLDRPDHGRGRAGHGLPAQPARRPCSAGSAPSAWPCRSATRSSPSSRSWPAPSSARS